jgi:hypothetical protein
MIISRVALLTIMVFTATAAEARVFDFSKQTFSTYLRASGGPTTLQRGAYSAGFPNSITFNDTNAPSTVYSAEIGLAFTNPNVYNFRLGVEGLYPYASGGSTGANGGTPEFTINSLTYAIIPQANFELFLKKKPNFRFYLGAGGGYAITSFDNNITMTPQGTTTYGVSNYSELASGTGIMGQGYLGMEFPAFDNIGFSFDVGYRYLVIPSFTASQSYTNLSGKIISQGSTITNADGSTRSLNLSGVFGAVSFRFYFN